MTRKPLDVRFPPECPAFLILHAGRRGIEELRPYFVIDEPNGMLSDAAGQLFGLFGEDVEPLTVAARKVIVFAKRHARKRKVKR